MFVQAESDAEEKDKQMTDLLVRMAQYEQVRWTLSDDVEWIEVVGNCEKIK